MISELTVHAGREITFRGEPICDISDDIDLTEWDERHLRLQVFTIEEGGFVGVIEFSSSNYAISTVRDAEELDTIDDLEKFFFAYDPLDHISYGWGRNASTSLNAHRHQLSQMYGRLVNQALAALADFCRQNPGCERKSTVRQKEVNRVLRFFGLG